jgi:hypothetical protein
VPGGLLLISSCLSIEFYSVLCDFFFDGGGAGGAGEELALLLAEKVERYILSGGIAR